MADDRHDFEDADLDRLEQLLRGEGTPRERAAAEAELRRRPSGQALLATLTTLDASRGLLKRWDASTALERFHKANELRGVRRPPRLVFHSERAGKRVRWMASAAALAGAAMIAVVVRNGAEDAKPGDQGAPPPRDIVTAPGQRAVLDLVDGTRVVLSPDSHLRIAGGFGAPNTKREVSLEGEALFVVPHDSARPFVIHTAHGSVEDLGTEFMVSTYPELNGTRLAVREGKVALHPRVPTPPSATPEMPVVAAILSPGDIGIMRSNGGVQIAHGQDLSDLFAASRGALTIRAQVLEEAIPRLERWFGVRVRVVDRALQSRRLSVELRDGTATDAFAIIALALKARASWHQNQVTLESDDLRGEDK